MGSGKVTKRRRKTPAGTAHEADSRWGLTRGRSIAAMGAYTAEDHERDVRSGVVHAPRLAHECPRGNPERDCTWRTVPPYYRAGWFRKFTRAPRKPTSSEPHPRPRRETTLARWICFDCQLWLQQVDRWRFISEHGEYHLESASLDCAVVDRTNRIADIAQVIGCQIELFAAEARELQLLTGGLDDEVAPFISPYIDEEDGSVKSERYEQATLLANARHAIERFAACRAGKTSLQILRFGNVLRFMPRRT